MEGIPLFSFLFIILLPCSFSAVCKCWRSLPDERPSFEEIASIFDRMTQEVTGCEMNMKLKSHGNAAVAKRSPKP